MAVPCFECSGLYHFSYIVVARVKRKPSNFGGDFPLMKKTNYSSVCMLC
jgi:hypothetical protein